VEDGEAVTLVTYTRTGGDRPRIDEELEIEPDGAFRMVRRVSADRAGTFAGALDATRLEQVQAALDALGEPLVIVPTRHGVVLELVDWAGGAASFPMLEDEIPREWLELREVLQTLAEDLKQDAVSALEIRLDDATETVTLEVVGTEPINVSFDGAKFALSLFDEDEEWLDSASVAAPDDLTGDDPLPVGWKREIALRHKMPFNAKRTLQLSIDLTIDGHDAQLTATAGKGWF
jgi:hypothetical protein